MLIFMILLFLLYTCEIACVVLVNAAGGSRMLYLMSSFYFLNKLLHFEFAFLTIVIIFTNVIIFLACRDNLQLLRQRYYYATWKADGTRYMMLITMDGCYLVDRNFNFRRVQMRFPCKSTNDVRINIICFQEGFWSVKPL